MAGQGERRREEVRGEADAHEDRRGVELDVRLERPIGMLLGQDPQRDILDGDRELQPLGLVGHRLGDFAQGLRPGVVGSIDAMAEAHQPIAASDRLADPALGIGR